ncbi:hypothetical protein PLICRDRAFT_181018 [Plicaturopsis crispa FD-325 SS-3]|uniref:Uncharacterized protein n=1 Tax=Plicaturopsis crispa FD-325 SS-3 TaxID=944288 RepID=A0A0C9T0Y8_PLICR|nr:hypothetical protein PLICRDRAFT_181018 [Plicaturopsis crispa FD-325 SS-3]
MSRLFALPRLTLQPIIRNPSHDRTRPPAPAPSTPIPTHAARPAHNRDRASDHAPHEHHQSTAHPPQHRAPTAAPRPTHPMRELAPASQCRVDSALPHSDRPHAHRTLESESTYRLGTAARLSPVPCTRRQLHAPRRTPPHRQRGADELVVQTHNEQA